MKLSKHRGVSVVVTMEEDMQRVRILYIVLLAFLCLVGCQKQEETLSLADANGMGTDVVEEERQTIFVYVCGAVQVEGVYELNTGSRVYEAIEKAGGFREDAVKNEVNQAAVLEDAAKLYIPTMGEVLDTQTQQDGKVNINRASKEELMTLPGVGESKANSIIRYREEQGAFGCIEDIMQISGIKEGLYEKIKDLIKI